MFRVPQFEKPVAWIGSSYRDLLNFPSATRREIGFLLGLVQNGGTPADLKPVEQVGAGTYELRVVTNEGGRIAHRVFFVAKFPEAVYVLRAFQKKTRATSKHDIGVGRDRYKEMLRHRRKLAE
jgi:phage-related protein